jgi:ribonuclease Z
VAGPIEHRIPSFGFVIQEADQVGKIDKDKLTALGVKPGPIYGKLKRGQPVTLDDGRVLFPDEFIGKSKRGKKVVILGDTKSTKAMEKLCSGCDLLVHEATMENSLVEKAIEYGHSTPDMAAQMAINVKAKQLVLTHLSPRYKPLSDQEATNENKVNDEDSSSSSSSLSSRILLDEANLFLQENGFQESCHVQVAEDFLEVHA